MRLTLFGGKTIPQITGIAQLCRKHWDKHYDGQDLSHTLGQAQTLTGTGFDVSLSRLSHYFKYSPHEMYCFILQCTTHVSFCIRNVSEISGQLGQKWLKPLVRLALRLSQSTGQDWDNWPTLGQNRPYFVNSRHIRSLCSATTEVKNG